MTWQAPLADETGRHGSFTVPAHFTSGQTIGIVTVDLDYPKLPGNVAIKVHSGEFGNKNFLRHPIDEPT